MLTLLARIIMVAAKATRRAGGMCLWAVCCCVLINSCMEGTVPVVYATNLGLEKPGTYFEFRFRGGRGPNDYKWTAFREKILALVNALVYAGGSILCIDILNWQLKEKADSEATVWDVRDGVLQRKLKDDPYG